MEKLRTTRCEINLDALKNNVDTIMGIAGDTAVMAIIKADAYGHGAAIMMKHMLTFGTKNFGVATLNEAMELRQMNKDGEILVLGYTADELLHFAAENNITQAIFSKKQAEILAALDLNAKVQIKVDSGMQRYGYIPSEEAAREVADICAMPALRVEGIFSHLALRDLEGDLWQQKNFADFVEKIESLGAKFKCRHLVDGIGFIRYPQMKYDMVRPGAAFYGFSQMIEGLQPIMTFKSNVARVHKVPAGQGIGYDLLQPVEHDRIVATLPFGYSDGCPRAMSHGVGYVTIRGKRAPFIGLLCMDICMVDVTDIEGVEVDDEVVIFGSGKNDMTYPEAAKLCNFNRNGLQSNIARRVPRVYYKAGQVVEYRDYLFNY